MQMESGVARAVVKGHHPSPLKLKLIGIKLKPISTFKRICCPYLSTQQLHHVQPFERHMSHCNGCSFQRKTIWTMQYEPFKGKTDRSSPCRAAGCICLTKCCVPPRFSLVSIYASNEGLWFLALTPKQALVFLLELKRGCPRPIVQQLQTRGCPPETSHPQSGFQGSPSF